MKTRALSRTDHDFWRCTIGMDDMSDSREGHRSLEPRRVHDEGLEPLREPPVFVRDQEPKKRAGFGVLGAILLAVLMKGKSLLVLLKALPAGKFLLTTLSMFAMVWVEAI